MLQEYFIKYKKYIFVAVIAIVALSILITVAMNSGGGNSSGDNQVQTQYNEETAVLTTEAPTEYVPPKTDNIMLNFQSNDYTKSKMFKEWAPNVGFIYFRTSYPDTLYITNDTRMVYADSNYALDISQAGDGSVVAYIESGQGDGYYWEKMYIAGRNGKVVSGPILTSLFAGLDELNWVKFEGNFDTSNCIDMSGMFLGCSYLSEVDVNTLDTSNVRDMSRMFSGCSYLLEELDLSGFDTSKCTNMNGMFENCYDLVTLNISGFDTSNVTNMSSMFSGCNSLTSIDISSFNTSKVTRMYGMFCGCGDLKTLDLSSFDFSSCEEFGEMFRSCESLVMTIDISGYYLYFESYGYSADYNYESMFDGSEMITVIYKGETYRFNQTGDSYDLDYGWKPLYTAIQENS